MSCSLSTGYSAEMRFDLTQFGPMMPYGDVAIFQHWFRYLAGCFAALVYHPALLLFNRLHP